MIEFASHTLVKNGQPFILPVLEQVAPYASRCYVTVSEKADMQTVKDVAYLDAKYPGKFIISTENVKAPGELTAERQKQLDRTTEPWVLFLDDDDWWPTVELERVIHYLSAKPSIDGLAINPFQLLGADSHDAKWSNRWFTKWFINNDTHYRHPWPRDLIYKGDELLYWKKNSRVPRFTARFFHLSYLKDGSFRKENWASKYAEVNPNPVSLPEEWKGEVCKILKYLS